MKKYFFLAAIAACFAACSSESEVADPNNGGSVAEGGEGYVSLAINLPTRAAGTRAANDVYDDGTANEYAVKDATLILFEGTTEAGATFSSAYSMDLTWNLEGTTTDNITSVAKIVQKIKDPLASGNKFYALVVLNNNGQLVVNPADNTLKVNTVSATGKTLATFISDFKLTDLATTKLLNGTIDENGAAAKDFFMSNAPLYSSVGGATLPTGDVMTLPAIDDSKIYETAAEAAAHPAVEISVERAVAKVTVRKSTSFAGSTSGTTTPLPLTDVKWHLNNTNTQAYLVRNVAGYKANWSTLQSNASGITKPYRFVGDELVTTGLFRTYWCADPNYSGMADGAGMKYWNGINAGKPAPAAANWIAAGASPAFGDPAYCAENTFDVAAQKDINSTAAIIEAQFNGGTTFYTLNNVADKPADLLNQAGMEMGVKSSFIGNAAIQAAMKAARPGTWTIDLSDPVQAAKVIVTLKDDSKAGVVGIKEILVKGSLFGGSYADDTDDIKATTLDVSGVPAIDIANGANKISRYVNGIAYYRVVIKHFGDDLTPWKTTEAPLPTAGEIYPATNQTANYLGRYGVVRNNWYDIEVSAIKQLGTPTPSKLGNTVTPDDPDDPTPDPDEPGDGGYDDDIEQYISVKINILSWAKRTQSIEL